MVSQVGDMHDAPRTNWFLAVSSASAATMQTSSHEAALGFAAASGGIACLARHRADQDYRLIRLSTPDEPPPAELWLVMHRDNRRTPRLRAVAIGRFVVAHGRDAAAYAHPRTVLSPTRPLGSQGLVTGAAEISIDRRTR